MTRHAAMNCTFLLFWILSLQNAKKSFGTSRYPMEFGSGTSSEAQSLTPGAGSTKPPRDGGVEKAVDPCGDYESRLQERRSWLSDRRAEQAKRRGRFLRTQPSSISVYCQAHPEDPQCKLGDPPTSFHPDEVSIEAQKVPEDRDPHVIRLRRELADCHREHPL